jgi:hypothetical protein
MIKQESVGPALSARISASRVRRPRGPMKIRLTLRPGMSGTKKLLARSGERLVCVRYRYDRATGSRIKTAELIVQDVAWTARTRKPRRNDHDLVGVRIDWKESELRAAVKRAGGIWRPRQQLWELSWDAVRTLGLHGRVVEQFPGERMKSEYIVAYGAIYR